MILKVIVHRVWSCDRCGAMSPDGEVLTIGQLTEWGRDHESNDRQLHCSARTSELSCSGAVRLDVFFGDLRSTDMVWARWPVGRVRRISQPVT